MMVLGIITACVSFFLIFVGAGLMLMKENPLALLFPIIPGLWLYNFVCEAVEQIVESFVRAEQTLRRRPLYRSRL